MSAEKTLISLQRGTSRRSSVVIKAKTNNLDEVLQAVGGCSHYQIRRHVLFFLLSIPLACQSLLVVFAGQMPDICLETNILVCRKVDTNRLDNYCPFSERHRFLQPKKFSVISEFQLVCDEHYWEQVANSLFFIGAFFGTIAIGWIAHRFGRKSVMFCCLAIVSFTATLSAFADSFWFFMMARFLTGFFLSGVTVSLYVIASEIMGAQYRFQSDLFIWNYFSAGLMILALKAYLLQNWRNLQLVTTIPYVLVFLFYRVFPESLRWLWSTGQYTRANKTVSKIAAENKKSEALSTFPDLLSIETEENGVSFFMLFRSKKLLLQFIVMAYCSFAIGVMYYGFFLMSNYLSGNLFMDFVLIAAMEIPANFAAIFCTKRFGRKKTVVLSFLITCIMCGSLYAIVRQQNADWRCISLGVGLTCKFFLTVGILSFMLWTDEIHHNIGRYQSIETITSLRPLGGAAAPWITTYFVHRHPGTAFVVMSGLSCLAFILCILLPETRKAESDESEEPEDEYKSLNGTIDQNLNTTKLSSISKPNDSIQVADMSFDYTALSLVDRETDI